MQFNKGEFMKDKIEKRVAELKKTREDFITKANTEVAALNAAIGELENLLKPNEPVAEVAE